MSALEKSTSPITSVARRDVHDHEIVRRHRAQAHGVRGIGFLRPVPVLAGAMEKARFGQPLAKIGNIHAAKGFAGGDGQLKRGAFQMIHQDFQIVRLDERVLGRAAEKIIRMLHDELIERRRGSDQHGAGASAAAPGAAGALPSGGNRSGIARHDRGVERADVDAQLQRVRRNHAANAAFAQAVLDFAALAGEIASAIAANGGRLSRRRRICLLQIGEQHFRVQARVGEHDGLQVALQEFLRDARRLVDIAAADSQKAIHDRRIVENEKFLSGGRAVFLDHLEIGFRQARRQFARIGDRRRGANELRIRAVEARDAPQPPQHIGQVAAEHAAIGVQLVQHDIAQVFKQALPARVVRQDSRVQHVRVGEHDVPALANRLARVGGRVAIVGEDAEAIVEARGQVVQLGKLILRERFGGEQVQRARVRIFQHRVQDRQVVAQRFSGGRRRDHHHVAPLHGRLPRPCAWWLYSCATPFSA